MKKLFIYKKLGYLFLAFTLSTNLVFCQETNLSENIASKQPVKDWNFMVYFTSNNNLFNNSVTNINQLMEIGSNQNINILIQQDEFEKQEIRRSYVEKGTLKLIDKQQNNQDSISGTPQNLYQFAKWAITNYPAKHQALIIWNHGSGIEDPSIWGKVNKNSIFSINPQTGLIELSRKSQKDRGIAFNEVFQTYITNPELKKVVDKVRDLLNKNIDILGMDACHMGMLEIGVQLKEAADYMVGSAEVILASGWNYSTLLRPFESKSLSPEEFCKQMISMYKQEYKNTYADHTLTAIKMKNLNKIEKTINDISILLCKLLQGKDKTLILEILKKIRTTPTFTTSFDNKNYIDLYHFYSSLLLFLQINSKNIQNKDQETMLEKLLTNGLNQIEEETIAFTVGTKLPNAHGLSFYFPKKKTHPSYFKTVFAKTNKWVDFLKLYQDETKI